MSTVGNATARRPSVCFQHVQYPQIFDQTVAKCTVELQDIAIGSHASVADQIACVLNRKQILSRCHGTLVVVSNLCLQFIIEGIPGLPVPPKFVWFKSVRVSNRGLEIKAPIC